ncbi:type II toxin-antitoxin system RelE/ParE family toxin [Natranaerofaba carboxydovora]|uniref:type II toxin-antitoxin system RelE/ParE family toxin n=1 Tax=Natranaerofaba carboxydovora TaxID=2742683 RepID=UPI001F1456B1|nr:type II toxin-antitoxin system RelE/ParE family toxin [Natranaerofaba carboxydovora]UMZ74524.1 ParE toxin of type II toxin-antitoxin system, parDE [Natranaerofaba carboxydovora]
MSKNKFNLKVTPAAYADLDNIYKYIVNDLYNRPAAENLIDKIEEAFLRLREFPFFCNLVEDEILKNKGYRKLIIENYVGFYIINEEKNEVIIMRVLYSKQKYEDII